MRRTQPHPGATLVRLHEPERFGDVRFASRTAEAANSLEMARFLAQHFDLTTQLGELVAGLGAAGKPTVTARSSSRMSQRRQQPGTSLRCSRKLQPH